MSVKTKLVCQSSRPVTAGCSTPARLPSNCSIETHWGLTRDSLYTHTHTNKIHTQTVPSADIMKQPNEVWNVPIYTRSISIALPTFPLNVSLWGRRRFPPWSKGSALTGMVKCCSWGRAANSGVTRQNWDFTAAGVTDGWGSVRCIRRLRFLLCVVSDVHVIKCVIERLISAFRFLYQGPAGLRGYNLRLTTRFQIEEAMPAV